MPSFDTPRPRTSDEEDEEEEVEFKLAEKKEEKPWFSLNKCIGGALVLLFLGSLFLSGEFLSYLTQPAVSLLLFCINLYSQLLYINKANLNYVAMIC